MLEMQGVQAGYGHLQVLYDTDLSVSPGELVTVVGANGAGKSTLLKTILGAVTPMAGEILFDGKRVTHMAAHKRVELGIALSPEGRQVFPRLTVKENLVSGTFGLPAREIKSQQQAVFDLFPRLAERTNQRAGSLSGGEQQMLAIGRALMSKPRLVLVDELSLGLAPIIVERLYASMRELCDNGLAVIVVEQFQRYLASHSDRSYNLEKGRFVTQSSGPDISDALASSAEPARNGAGSSMSVGHSHR
jgi:branched-chain amino acid transport system ATP-binding protein